MFLGKTWPVVSYPYVLDILRDKFQHEISKETRVLYVVPLVNIYESMSREMEKLHISYQILCTGSCAAIDPSVKVVFVSPERLLNEAVLNSILKLNWNCVSIDEPHLCLEWGLAKSKKQKPFRIALSNLII